MLLLKIMIMDLRSFVALMVCALSFCVAGADFNQAKDSSKANNYNPMCPRGHLPIAKLIPHEEDCSLFYICQNGQAILQKCPFKLYFNPSKSVCDFPGNTKCQKDDTLNSRGRISDQQLFVSCPMTPVHLLLPHPTDCGKFFSCDAGIAHLAACQQGLHFNEKLQTCDYPENAGCDTGFTETPQGKIGEGISNGLCPSEKTKFPVLKPHSTDCGKFYLCDGGTPHLKVCQPGLHFNPKTQTCDYPQNAGCESDQSNKDPSGRLGDIGVCSTSQNGIVPHSSDCGKFFMCDKGQSFTLNCPPGLHFNAALQVCDYPENAQCEKESVRHSVGVPSPFCPTIEGKTPVFYIHPTNCSVYYMCSNGMAYRFECPARLHFNLRLRICDYEWVARCPSGKSSDKGNHRL